MNLKEFSEIDNYLTNSVSVSENYFDTKLLVYPSNDYLLGMNIYINYIDGDRKKLEQLLDGELLTNNLLNNSTYIELAKGIISFNKGNEKVALSHYLRSLEIDTLSDNKNKWVRLELYFYYKEKEPNVAMKYLNGALSIDKSFTPAQYELAFISREEGDLDGAITILDDIISRIDDDNSIYTKAYILEEKGDVSGAEELYSKLINKSKFIEAYIGLGTIAQYFHEDFEKAEFYFRESLKVNEKFDEAYMRLFRLYVEKENPEKANEFMRKGYQINGSDDNLLNLIYSEALLDRYDESRSLIQNYYDEFGTGYEIDLWDILISSLSGNKEEGQLKIDKYYENYTSAEVNFLKTELEAWNITVIKPN